MSQLPTGTVTLLFTDIEGSTRLLQRAGDAYPDLLEAHRRLLRGAFQRHGGQEVATDGDAFFVAFPSAKGAVAAATEAQQALAAHPWPEGHEIRVRIGVHTGEPRLVERNYVGLDVHRASRVMAAGHGGQVLLSQSTRDLLEEQFELRDLGQQRLKDLSEPQRLYQLRVDGLPDEFPALKTLESRPTNLPVQPTPLVGRVRELGELAEILQREDVRLLTLTGTGGTGKTRLALQAAADLVERFSDGVFFVALAPISDPGLILPTIAQTLGLREAPGEPLATTLKNYLGERAMLLLLDNFEHLLPAAPRIAALLAEASELRILATSRERLAIAAEHEYQVPSLVPAEAVALFTARARQLKPAFEPDEHVDRICARLDDLPLALELAAARVKVLRPTVQEVEEGDAGNACLRAQPDAATRLRHLPAARRGRTGRTRWRRRLGDHRPTPVAQHEVQVAIFLRPVERHCGRDAEDVPLEGETAGGAPAQTFTLQMALSVVRNDIGWASRGPIVAHDVSEKALEIRHLRTASVQGVTT